MTIHSWRIIKYHSVSGHHDFSHEFGIIHYHHSSEFGIIIHTYIASDHIAGRKAIYKQEKCGIR